MSKISDLRKQHNDKIVELMDKVSKKEILISGYQKRIPVIEHEAGTLQTDVNNLKAEQMQAISDGEDYFPIRQELMAKNIDKETFDGAIAALKNSVSSGIEEIKALKARVNACRVELLKLDAVALAKEYNEKAAALAEVVKKYKENAEEIGKLAPKAVNSPFLYTGIDMIRRLVYAVKTPRASYPSIAGVKLLKFFVKLEGEEQNDQPVPIFF